jgi:hypothetical protein
VKTVSPLTLQSPTVKASTKTLQPPSVKEPTKTPTSTPTSTPTEQPPPPGGGSSGITKSDLEITNIGPVPTTRAEKVFVDLKNNGPDTFSGQIRVVCVGAGYHRTTPNQMIPTASDELINLTIGVGTGFFYPSMIIDVPIYSYSPIQCIIEVPDNKDPNTSNNTYSILIP